MTAFGNSRHYRVISTASVLLMNSSLLSMASRALRTLSETSADPRCSTQFDTFMMAASRASWFSLSLNSREGFAKGTSARRLQSQKPETRRPSRTGCSTSAI